MILLFMILLSTLFLHAISKAHIGYGVVSISLALVRVFRNCSRPYQGLSYLAATRITTESYVIRLRAAGIDHVLTAPGTGWTIPKISTAGFTPTYLKRSSDARLPEQFPKIRPNTHIQTQLHDACAVY